MVGGVGHWGNLLSMLEMAEREGGGGGGGGVGGGGRGAGSAKISICLLLVMASNAILLRKRNICESHVDYPSGGKNV